jgi:hypothetical protein
MAKETEAPSPDEVDEVVRDAMSVESQPAAAPPEGDEDSWDSETVALAKSYGLTEEDLGKYDDKEQLETVFAVIERQQALQTPTTAPQPRVSPQQLPPTHPLPGPGQTPEVFDLPELSDLDPDDPVRKTLETVVAQTRATAKQNQQLTALMAQQYQEKINAQNAKFISDFDDRLDADGSDLYGNRKKGNVTPAQERARADVYEVFSLQANRNVDIDTKMLRAKHAAGHPIGKSSSKAEAIKKRSKRRSSSGRRPARSAPREGLKKGEKLSNDPSFMSKVEQIVNG